MQSTNVYLYDNIISVNTDDSLANNRIWGPAMYKRQLNVYRGVENALQFVIKNQEQKPVNINGSTITFILMDKDDGSSVIERSATVLNGQKGICEIKLTDGDTFSLAAKYYNYALLYNSDETTKVVYSDTGYNVSGIVQLLDNVYPTFIPSQEDALPHVSDSEIIVGLNGDAPITRHIAGSFDAQPSQNTRVALHTVQYYLTNFTGVITVEGTLNTSATLTDIDWAEITMDGENTPGITFANQSGVVGYTFSGIFENIRVKYRFTTTIDGAPTGPLVAAGIASGNKTANVSGTNIAPVFTVGDVFYVDQTKVTMTGTTSTTFVSDFNAIGFANITASIAGNGSILLSYTGGSSFDLSYSGVDKVLYRP